MKHKYFRTCLLLVVTLLAATMFSTTAFAALPEGVPSSLEAPSLQQIEQKTNEDGSPYFEAQVYFPQSVLNLDSEAPGGGSVFWDYAVKVDNGSWSEFGGGGYINVYTGGEDGEAPVSAGSFAITFDPIDEGSLTSVDIKSHIYSYQLRVYYDYYEGWPDVQPIYSPVSNVVTIGSGSFYSDASTWAETELKKANELGLIPNILKGADMTKPITREEFCELAVLLYTMSGIAEINPKSFTMGDLVFRLKDQQKKQFEEEHAFQVCKTPTPGVSWDYVETWEYVEDQYNTTFLVTVSFITRKSPTDFNFIPVSDIDKLDGSHNMTFMLPAAGGTATWSFQEE